MIPAPARDRLAKVLGLLGSDAAGERAAAGLLASRLLRELGLSWSDVLASAPAAAPVVTADHRLAARLCLASAVPWGAWSWPSSAASPGGTASPSARSGRCCGSVGGRVSVSSPTIDRKATVTRPAFVLLDRARSRSAAAADPDLLALRLGTAALCRVSAVTLDRWARRGLGQPVARLPGADAPLPLAEVRALVAAVVAGPPAPSTAPTDDGPSRRTFTVPPL